MIVNGISKYYINFVKTKKQKVMIEKGRILPGKVLVKPLKQDDKKGSIIIPSDVIKPKTYAGELVVIGDPLPTFKVELSVGEKILYPPHAFAKVEIDGVELNLLNVTDILFIWK
jgi:co-chaperonin GroES (HSP10)